MILGIPQVKRTINQTQDSYVILNQNTSFLNKNAAACRSCAARGDCSCSHMCANKDNLDVEDPVLCLLSLALEDFSASALEDFPASALEDFFGSCALVGTRSGWERPSWPSHTTIVSLVHWVGTSLGGPSWPQSHHNPPPPWRTSPWCRRRLGRPSSACKLSLPPHRTWRTSPWCRRLPGRPPSA